ncbi:MAG: L-threonylcarbamoyladenylate synthase, partial [Verrucomicrobiota bacterium]
METRLLLTDTELTANEAVRAAVDCLNAGDVVALPTETVYGLGADAMDPAAVAKVFEAKQRPTFDPLIVHVPRKVALHEVAEVPEEIAKVVTRMVETFWPGPLTLVLPKKPAVPDIVTAGLPTVAVRMGDHPIFARIVKQFGRPIAAPSANLFGKLSPTSAAAVGDQLWGRIPLIIDGGACARGLESTIVKVHPGESKPVLEILRPGPITEVDLKPIGKVVFAKGNADVENAAPEAPGQLASHYAPKTSVRLCQGPDDFRPEPGKRYALLSYRGQATSASRACPNSLRSAATASSGRSSPTPPSKKPISPPT